MEVVQQTAQLKVTPVFEKIWNALHAMKYNADGSPALDEKTGQHLRLYKYIKLIGSSRSSKTFSMIDCYDLLARSNKGKRLTVWRNTAKDCKETVLNDMQKHLKEDGRWFSGMNFHETTSVMRYSGTGSKIEIHGTDDELTVHGLTQDWAWLNEPYKISKAVFDQIDQRTAEAMIIDMNPLMSHWSEDLEKDKRCITIHSTFEDNPFCPTEMRLKILSYQPVSCCAIVIKKKLTEPEAKKYDCIANLLLFPAWAIEELVRCIENEYKRSANKFNWEVYGLGVKSERPNRVFHFEEVPNSVYEKLDVPVYSASDWGVVDPWAVLDAKYYDGALYLHEQNYASENEIREGLSTTELLQIGPQEQEGIVGWLFKRLKIPYERVIVCDPNRVMKIRSLREAGWDYAIAAQKPAGSIIDGITLVNDLRVYYTASSVNLKYEQENYVRKVDTNGKVLEEPEDINNHLMDDTRYVATFLEQQGIIRRK